MNGLQHHRRRLATWLLAIAITLLLAGETLFRHRLGPLTTLLYWTTCLLTTLGAIGFALLDLLGSARESRAEQSAMIEQAIHEIENARKQRSLKSNRPPPESR